MFREIYNSGSGCVNLAALRSGGGAQGKGGAGGAVCGYFFSSSGQTVENGGYISFDSSTVRRGVEISGAEAVVSRAGIYRIDYSLVPYAGMPSQGPASCGAEAVELCVGGRPALPPRAVSACASAAAVLALPQGARIGLRITGAGAALGFAVGAGTCLCIMRAE
jgi:hypothetical protein